MTDARDRDQQWWILSPDDSWPDKDGDLDRLVKAVEDRDWAVFADDPASPGTPPVALALSESTDGRKICVGMIVGLNEAYPTGDGRGSFGVTTEVTSRALRGIPVAELIGRAVRDDRAPERHSHFRNIVLARMPKSEGVRLAPGPRGHPDEHFRLLADRYREALETEPGRPMAWLAEQYPEVDRSTVARWVQRARDKGYLGDSQAGRAGEVTGEDS